MKEKILKLIAEAAESLGYGVYEASMLLRGENSRIVVKIDHVNGISHQDCENYSKRLAFLLDRDQLLPNYFLEISSPGLSRKLAVPGDLIRFSGAPVKIKWDNDERIIVTKGNILNVDDDNVILETEQGELSVPLRRIEQANLDY